MKTLILLFAFSIISTTTFGQSDQQVQLIKNYFNGNQIRISYRQGGVLYGTYFFYTINYCQNGNYNLKGYSEKRTVLGNVQRNNWVDQGSWEVIKYQEKIGIKSVNSYYQISFYPIQILPNNQLSLGPGISMQQIGSSGC